MQSVCHYYCIFNETIYTCIRPNKYMYSVWLLIFLVRKQFYKNLYADLFVAIYFQIKKKIADLSHACGAVTIYFSCFLFMKEYSSNVCMCISLDRAVKDNLESASTYFQ